MSTGLRSAFKTGKGHDNKVVQWAQRAKVKVYYLTDEEMRIRHKKWRGREERKRKIERKKLEEDSELFCEQLKFLNL